MQCDFLNLDFTSSELHGFGALTFQIQLISANKSSLLFMNKARAASYNNVDKWIIPTQNVVPTTSAETCEWLLAKK